MKCTSAPCFNSDGSLSFELSKPLFDKMHSPSKINPWYLFILILPEDVNGWVQVSEEDIVEKGVMLWYNVEDHQNSSSGATVTLRIPMENRVTNESLQKMLLSQLERYNED